MKSKEINVCLTSDNNYAEHMYVTVVSLIVNLNRNCRCTIWILDAGLSDNVKNMFLLLEKNYEGISVKFINIDVSNYKSYPSFMGTYQTYFRIDIPNLLPHLDKILYLDPDIVVNADVSDLFDINLNNYAIAAPTSINTYYYYYYSLNIPKDFGYFNGGVLLMNLEYMRKHRLSNKMFDYIKTNSDKIVSFDQDAFNAILYDKRYDIGREYNIIFLTALKYFYLKKADTHPAIIHYGARRKPWKKYCIHPLGYEYHYYRKIAGLKPIVFNKKFNFTEYFLSRKDKIIWCISILFPEFFHLIAFFRFKIFHKK